MINYLIEKYFALLGGVAYSNATSMSAFNYYEFEKRTIKEFKQIRKVHHYEYFDIRGYKYFCRRSLLIYSKITIYSLMPISFV